MRFSSYKKKTCLFVAALYASTFIEIISSECVGPQNEAQFYFLDPQSSSNHSYYNSEYPLQLEKLEPPCDQSSMDSTTMINSSERYTPIEPCARTPLKLDAISLYKQEGSCSIPQYMDTSQSSSCHQEYPVFARASSLSWTNMSVPSTHGNSDTIYQRSCVPEDFPHNLESMALQQRNLHTDPLSQSSPQCEPSIRDEIMTKPHDTPLPTQKQPEPSYSSEYTQTCSENTPSRSAVQECNSPYGIPQDSTSVSETSTSLPCESEQTKKNEHTTCSSYLNILQQELENAQETIDTLTQRLESSKCSCEKCKYLQSLLDLVNSDSYAIGILTKFPFSGSDKSSICQFIQELINHDRKPKLTCKEEKPLELIVDTTILPKRIFIKPANMCVPCSRGAVVNLNPGELNNRIVTLSNSSEFQSHSDPCVRTETQFSSPSKHCGNQRNMQTQHSTQNSAFGRASCTHHSHGQMNQHQQGHLCASQLERHPTTTLKNFNSTIEDKPCGIFTHLQIEEVRRLPENQEVIHKQHCSQERRDQGNSQSHAKSHQDHPQTHTEYPCAKISHPVTQPCTVHIAAQASQQTTPL